MDTSKPSSFIRKNRLLFLLSDAQIAWTEREREPTYSTSQRLPTAVSSSHATLPLVISAVFLFVDKKGLSSTAGPDYVQVVHSFRSPPNLWGFLAKSTIVTPRSPRYLWISISFCTFRDCFIK
ncbi:hypothetical protein GALMADRAFT_1114744 [Galerina marginata CBS 339.88]|uniref:Uncharacterized protein n=1 Tax=Galerina marginata (strain CBS 339.88) TaxID=685588 RepID=A0A067TPN8_GALM3|nr:hypothetical protein GALMADRAFT_1114744 [Galerina marginata CBS 339.88]